MATIKDVAQKAGVAVSTASYAINGRSSKVNDDTAKKVLKAAEKLNYRPNAIARSLARKKTDTIGLFLLLDHLDLNHLSVIELIIGIMDISRKHGYDIVLFSNREVEEVSYVEKCKERSVDGAIIFGMYNDDPHLDDIKNSEIPIISIDVPICGEKTTYVSSDDQKGAYTAVKYLLENGHQNVAFINGASDIAESKARLVGYKQAFEEANITYEQNLISDGEFKREVAYQKTLQLLASKQEFSAIFVATNLMSLGVMDALDEKNIKTPKDLSVVGFDDISLPDQMSIDITTVSQKKGEIGCQAIEKLIKIIEGETDLEPVLVNYKLNYRGSVAERK